MKPHTITQKIVDKVRCALNLAPIHRHEYVRVQQWCYIDGNLVMARRDRCDCGHETNVTFSRIASAADLAEADKRRFVAGSLDVLIFLARA